MKYIFTSILALIILCNNSLAQKKTITQEDYKDWNTISSQQISNSGNIITYVHKPLLGDGTLIIYNKQNKSFDSIPRAYRAEISPYENYIVCKIKAPYDSTRQAKIDKVKKDEMPGDSLCIYYVSSRSTKKFPMLESLSISDESSNYFAFQLKKEFFEVAEDTSVTDSLAVDSIAEVESTNKSTALPLLIYNPITKDSIYYEYIENYIIADKSGHIAFIQEVKDSLDSAYLYIFDPAKQQTSLILSYQGEISDICFDENGESLAFMHTADTNEIKKQNLSIYTIKSRKQRLIVDTSSIANTPNYYLSEHQSLYFSKSGQKLFFGIAALPMEEVEDTIPADEKVHLDLWSYHDEMLQPYQKKNAKEEKKRTYLSVYHVKQKEIVLLEDKTVEEVYYNTRNESSYALGYHDQKYRLSMSWETPGQNDIYLVNISTGKKELVLEAHRYNASLSAAGKYILYYSETDSSWYSMDTKSKEKHSLTKNIGVNFYNEKHDTPIIPYPYAITGWAEDDKYVYINDSYDIWKIDPSGKEKAVNITASYGRNNQIRFRYLRVDEEEIFVSQTKDLLLHATNTITKDEGYFNANFATAQAPEQLISTAHKYRFPVKAKESDVFIWRRENFQQYPNLQLSARDFKIQKTLSDANPQQEDFRWGNVELVKWKSFSLHQDSLEGLLYTPEGFDANKTYPMIVYFYTRNSDELHNYWVPNPSRSIINPSTYCSNGYVIFIPDITYSTGQPGQDAYDAIVSGTEYIINSYPFVDKEHIGIQGQSWGGYQVAYLVTQTDMYAAAMAGAAVSNMVSAYGGIRWSSGMSRAFQYECGQSRIGYSLWEAREFYIKNSPIFFADQVKTPLLMMHNDNDGAVPWYQSIEYFSALRRLNKKVWLLVYNNEKHNLTKWPNRMDLDIRMMQFFDYYLKETAAPRWMEEGIDATEKGIDLKYELTE
jgi:dipeptidyl aminopeptidase/acylaminoacyl peptidase